MKMMEKVEEVRRQRARRRQVPCAASHAQTIRTPLGVSLAQNQGAGAALAHRLALTQQDVALLLLCSSTTANPAAHLAALPPLSQQAPPLATPHDYAKECSSH